MRPKVWCHPFYRLSVTQERTVVNVFVTLYPRLGHWLCLTLFHSLTKFCEQIVSALGYKAGFMKNWVMLCDTTLQLCLVNASDFYVCY
mmetsp:Transcript_48579/g.146516  ORF Transcript_48579/g.146516 Transcript_48579/m.146516 type:complete len:88 (-) Transcript_48579:130-393(-)